MFTRPKIKEKEAGEGPIRKYVLSPTGGKLLIGISHAN